MSITTLDTNRPKSDYIVFPPSEEEIRREGILRGIHETLKKNLRVMDNGSREQLADLLMNNPNIDGYDLSHMVNIMSKPIDLERIGWVLWQYSYMTRGSITINCTKHFVDHILNDTIEERLESDRKDQDRQIEGRAKRRTEIVQRIRDDLMKKSDDE